MSVGIGFLEVTHPHVYTRADILGDMDGVELVGVWEPDDAANAAVFAERYRVANHADPDALLSDERIQGVIVEPWTRRMADVAIMALEAGKHVLLE